ncbi:MAG: hypothetical protein GF334_09165 [Candidatus Altiarchaeales archaeon]|nr:hypothetical protein [Candidatus Altiarchaeales archaeon]
MKNRMFLFASVCPPLQKLIEDEGGVVVHDTKEYFDVVIFPPGEDVSPFLYGQKKMEKTNNNFIRDMRENALYRRLPGSVPKIGVGRGAQFLNVMSGGTLYQYTTGHLSSHKLLDFITDNEMLVTSCHRQQMVLPDGADMLAGACESDRKEGPGFVIHNDLALSKNKTQWPDVEVGYVDWTTSLLFQPRPELPSNDEATKNTANYFFQLIDDWVIPSIKKFPTRLSA